MPTDEWFKENPKVSAYIPHSLNEKLTDWMKERSIKKVSQALTTILEEHLGVVQNKPIPQPDRDDGLETLKQEFDSLSQTVQELKELIQASSPRVVQTELFPVKPIEETLSGNETIALIDEKQPIDILEEIQDDKPEQILDKPLELETQDSTQETDEELITTDKSEEVEKSSPKVKGSNPISKSHEFERFNPIMANAAVSKLINESINTIRSRHTHNREFQAKGYHFSPIKEEGKPRWKVEETEKDEF